MKNCVLSYFLNFLELLYFHSYFIDVNTLETGGSLNKPHTGGALIKRFR